MFPHKIIIILICSILAGGVKWIEMESETMSAEKPGRSSMKSVAEPTEGSEKNLDFQSPTSASSRSNLNFYITKLTFSAGIGGLLFGYDTGIIVHAYIHYYTQY